MFLYVICLPRRGLIWSGWFKPYQNWLCCVISGDLRICVLPILRPRLFRLIYHTSAPHHNHRLILTKASERPVKHHFVDGTFFPKIVTALLSEIMLGIGSNIKQESPPAWTQEAYRPQEGARCWPPPIPWWLTTPPPGSWTWHPPPGSWTWPPLSSWTWLPPPPAAGPDPPPADGPDPPWQLDLKLPPPPPGSWTWPPPPRCGLTNKVSESITFPSYYVRGR